jgi:hypothetical protein
MSFTLQAAGKIPDAIEQVKAATGYGDTSQFDAVRALIIAELEAWPTGQSAMTGVFVDASGHHDTASSRSLNITIRPLYLKG